MDGTFSFGGHVMPYLAAAYNNTRVNERAVEVPVALWLLQSTRASRVLEVGCVTPHYLPDNPSGHHTVIDLYEKYPGVINEDILTWQARGRYDLILSVSTLDHLKSEDDFLKAVARLKSFLDPSGLLYITLPYGQPSEVGGGPWVDRFVEETDMFVIRYDKHNPYRHEWAAASNGTPPLAYNGQSPMANTVHMLFYGDVESWLPV